MSHRFVCDKDSDDYWWNGTRCEESRVRIERERERGREGGGNIISKLSTDIAHTGHILNRIKRRVQSRHSRISPSPARYHHRTNSPNGFQVSTPAIIIPGCISSSVEIPKRDGIMPEMARACDDVFPGARTGKMKRVKATSRPATETIHVEYEH